METAILPITPEGVRTLLFMKGTRGGDQPFSSQELAGFDDG